MEKAMIYFLMWYFYREKGNKEDSDKAGALFDIECQSDPDIFEAMGWDQD